jgi:RNA polymerase sigma-70 factor, ECF subfamily
VAKGVTRPQAGADEFGPEAQAALALRVFEGDGAAENELARLFQRRVLLMTRSRVRNPETARDLTQEVLMAVVLALRKGKVREGEKLAAFVYGTARNVVNGFFRSKPPDCVPLFPEAATSHADDVVQDLHERTLMRRVMQGLDDADRRILNLTLVEGLKPGEIAERLNLSSEVVRARKSRAVKRAVACVRESSAPSLQAPARQE